MALEFVQAVGADKPYLLELRKLTMVEHLEAAGLYLSHEEHVFRIDDAFEHSSLIFLAGELVGALKHRKLNSSIEIMQLQIHPEKQGRGIGQLVMQKILFEARDSQKKVQLSVLKASPAKLLYQRLGFSITSEDEYEYYMELDIGKE